MKVIIYLVIGIVFAVWTHVIAGEYPEDLHGGEIAICIIAILLLWPVFLRLIFEETLEAFK
jgi:hypothetical protein